MTPGTTERPLPPRPVDLSRWLWIGSAALGTVRFLLQLTDSDMLIDELRKQQPNLGQDEIDGALNASIAFSLLAGIVLVLVYASLANRMARGRNWARIVLTVIGGAGVLFGLTRLVAVGTGLAAAFGFAVDTRDLVLGLVTMSLDCAAIVLMFVPSAAGHFRRAAVGQRTGTPGS
ncbi:hypothetical protein [Umezawaea sp. Da 62-37]|uniref:hypothetical protein n=1 Tax=Umezawaea sp. Da 62-37 TaxID=3075927 RepID=UPI0028F6D9BF|nr:hypothetical protein [Umezawaea sp. Da 62-37]WNV91037.1 hypothetical protein RM788_22985 [Umezawaea sp. Da 62-37]